MGDKQLLLDALSNKQAPRPAWVPFVGVHGGRLIGKSAEEYLKSADNLVGGLIRANELYRPDGLPIAFDLQLEAEVLGCELRWAEKEPPAVTTHPLAGGRPLSELPVFDIKAGRLPLVAEATRRMADGMGKNVGIYGLICGPFTLSLHLLGSDIFLKMFEDPGYVDDVGGLCADVARQMADLYIDSGADAIAVVDPMTSQISPAHFEQFVTPHVNAVFDHIRSRGALSSMFVCGDATRNLEKMCQTHCDNVSIDENISLDKLVELGGRFGKSVGGNLKLTTVLLMGHPADAKRDAIHCIDAGGTRGFVLAPGCDLPYDVPPENLQAVAEMALNKYARDVTRTAMATVPEDNFDDVEILDYASENGIVIDVITLDSAACAPCQYMVEAVEKAIMDVSANVVVREHKIKTRGGLGYMTKLGVAHIPTICIDGQTVFSSLIPDQETLVRTIEAKAAEKARANGGNA